MRNALWTLAAVALVALTACSLKVASARRATNTDPLIVRAHFIGSEQLFASPDSAKLKEVWSAKSSAALRDLVLSRCAELPAFWLGDTLPKGSLAQTNLLRPLLADVLAGESYLECTAAPEFVLAVKLTEARAQTWQTNLWQALVNWKLGQPATVKGDGVSGFEIKRNGLPGSFRCVRAGGWMVVSAGNGKLKVEAELLASIKSTGRPAKPTGAWLDGVANLARFDGWLPVLANFENLPIARFSFSNRADLVRTYATLDFPKPHGWKPEPWLFPSNQIHDPLISFIAARGIATIFEAFKPLRDLGYQPTPNQISGWAYGTLPFQFNYAAPSRNVLAQLKKLEPQLETLVLGREPDRRRGTIDWMTNGQRLAWRGLPFTVPHLGALRDSGHEFLAMDCYLSIRSSNTAPPGLYQALRGRDELAVFDWEITELRLPHWRQGYHLADIATGRVITSTNSPFPKWILETASRLGEAVTEVRVNSPAQMTLVRKSSIGLTAFEIMTLGRWVESTNFPAFGVFPPQPVTRPPPNRRAPRR